MCSKRRIKLFDKQKDRKKIMFVVNKKNSSGNFEVWQKKIVGNDKTVQKTLKQRRNTKTNEVTLS